MSGGAPGSASMSGGASGGALTFTATLKGAYETPPTNSKATGTATAMLKGHKLTVHGSFQGLSSSLFNVEGTPAHIHQAPSGVSGPIAFKLTVQASGMSGGASGGGQSGSGTFKGTFTLSSAQVLALKMANFYINVHTKNHHEGAIRGQLIVGRGSVSGGAQSGGQQSGGAVSGSPMSGGASGGGQSGGATSGGMASGGAQSGGAMSGGQQGQQSGGAASGGAMKPSNPGHPNQKELSNADQDTDWLMYNKGYSGLRYSNLKQIDTSNVSNLKSACSIKLGGGAGFSSFESTPQEYNGVMYVSTAHNTYAIDPTTCKKKWEYDYKPVGPETQPAVRGVALYNGMVFSGTTDAHIIALDMTTGKLLWNVQPKGINPAKGYFFSSVPVVYDGLLLIGTAGGDWGAPAVMFALDPATGKVVWRFSEIKADTFGKNSADTGAGSNWSSYTVDTKTGLVYIPVGNPGPDFAAYYRPGKNLYTDSVIVLNTKTGKLDHYYQQVPNDFHDWDTSPQPVLFKLNGKKYLAVGSKDGYVYVYNETSQKLDYTVAVTRIKNQTTPLTPAGVNVCPSGAMQWYGPTFDPQTGYIYTNSTDRCITLKKGEVHYVQGAPFLGTANGYGNQVGDSYGWTTAIDASTGKIVWKRKSDTHMQSSVTPTAGGIVFTGDLNGHFLALNAKNGKVLYNFNLSNDIAGGISTYEVNGKQYVAVAAGSSSRSVQAKGNTGPTVYVFSLSK
jgi:alcohol dehydrogenase (cytochrome c)